MLTAGRASTAAAVFEDLLERRTGQRLGSGRQWRIATALTPLLAEFGAASLDALAAMLAGRAPRLADRVVDALVNGESSFFRDAAAFELVGGLLCELADEAGDRPLRLWSAGCSTGQEPLSLAMLAAEAGRAAEIVASDVSPGAIARARTGRYTQFEIQRGLSIHRMVRWFEPAGGDWAARAELTRAIRWRVGNLLDPPPAIAGFDLILCRNLLFYLAPQARAAAVARLAEALRPGGLLVLGAGETLIGDDAGLTPSRRHKGAYVRPATLAARERAA